MVGTGIQQEWNCYDLQWTKPSFPPNQAMVVRDALVLLTPARPVFYFFPFLNSLRAVSTSDFDQNRTLIPPTFTIGGTEMRSSRMALCRFGWCIPSILATSGVEYFRMLIYLYITRRECVNRNVHHTRK
jgi:hypothetical protein